jgi:hypothetical protein
MPVRVPHRPSRSMAILKTGTFLRQKIPMKLTYVLIRNPHKGDVAGNFFYSRDQQARKAKKGVGMFRRPEHTKERETEPDRGQGRREEYHGNASNLTATNQQ